MIGRFHELVKYMSVIQYCISFHAFRSCISTTMPNGIYGIITESGCYYTKTRMKLIIEYGTFRHGH